MARGEAGDAPLPFFTGDEVSPSPPPSLPVAAAMAIDETLGRTEGGRGEVREVERVPLGVGGLGGVEEEGEEEEGVEEEEVGFFFQKASLARGSTEGGDEAEVRGGVEEGEEEEEVLGGEVEGSGGSSLLRLDLRREKSLEEDEEVGREPFASPLEVEGDSATSLLMVEVEEARWMRATTGRRRATARWRRQREGREGVGAAL